jgi:hypothetical protein
MNKRIDGAMDCWIAGLLEKKLPPHVAMLIFPAIQNPLIHLSINPKIQLG